MKPKILIFLVVVLISVFISIDAYAQSQEAFYDWISLRGRSNAVIDSAVIASTDGSNEISNITALEYSMTDTVYIYMWQDSVIGTKTEGDSLQSKVYVTSYGDIGRNDVIATDTLAGGGGIINFSAGQTWQLFKFLPRKSYKYDITYQPRYGTDISNQILVQSEAVTFKRYVFVKKSESSIRMNTR